MTAAAIKGWCPSAYRPMVSGDGLLVRIKPRAGRLNVDAALCLADHALRFGNGMIDLTARANLQMRGVTEAGFPELLEALKRDGLVDPDPAVEGGLSSIVTPFWQPGDLTDQLVEALSEVLSERPELPDKMGVAIDSGARPMLQDVSADVRFETGLNGALLMVADGAEAGVIVTPDNAAEALRDLLDWFVESGGLAHKRMARHLVHVPLPEKWQMAARQSGGTALQPGQSSLGPVVGTPFGATTAEELTDLIAATAPGHLRITPWRCLVLEGGKSAAVPGFVDTANSPIMAVSACPGRPSCAASSVATRGLARRLAGRAMGGLHVSGCEKGCAHPRPAGTTLVGRDGRFDLVHNGTAGDTPTRRGLSKADLMELFP